MLRNRVPDKVNEQDLNVTPGSDIDQALTSSGFSAGEALRTADLGALTKMLNAEYALDGSVSKTDAGFKVEARLRLAADPDVAQPLAVVEATKLEDAANKIADEIDRSIDQLKAYN